jgi:glycerol-3-phosphate dehydrogenase (NAD(P)+)
VSTRRASADGARRAVVGAGTWGTTLALLLARSAPVTLLARDEAQTARLRQDVENRRSLPGVPLPPEVAVTADPATLASASDLVVFAVPAAAMRSSAARVAASIHVDAVLVSVAKGIEHGTLSRMTEVIASQVPGPGARVAALSGPTLAPEIARGLPAGAVVAAVEDEAGRRVVDVLGDRMFRLYRNRDVVGVELCGALKNIVAIAAGAVEALGFGDNAKAAIVTRGLAEMTRLGAAAGANPLTFAGLAGIGDVLATCASPLSRNHRLGLELGAGRAWSQIEGTLPGIAEGAYTVSAALALAERHAVELPIAREVNAVLHEGKGVRDCVEDLLSRSSKDELAGIA